MVREIKRIIGLLLYGFADGLDQSQGYPLNKSFKDKYKSYNLAARFGSACGKAVINFPRLWDK